MNKQFAPYHIAVAMKELGFEELCFGFYREEDEHLFPHTPIKKHIEDLILAPTFQQAMDWFEDEHNIYIARSIDTTVNEIADFTYHLKSWRFPPVEIEFEDVYDCFDRHKARVACLDKMIEIVK